MIMMVMGLGMGGGVGMDVLILIDNNNDILKYFLFFWGSARVPKFFYNLIKQNYKLSLTGD